MSHHQLTQTNRIEIAILFRTGMSYRDIGKQIGCHHSTVSRELRRHTWHNPSGYNALQAKRQLAKTRLLANQHKRKLPVNEALVVTVTKRLIRNDSPQQIAGVASAASAVRFTYIQNNCSCFIMLLHQNRTRIYQIQQD